MQNYLPATTSLARREGMGVCKTLSDPTQNHDDDLKRMQQLGMTSKIFFDCHSENSTRHRSLLPSSSSEIFFGSTSATTSHVGGLHHTRHPQPINLSDEHLSLSPLL